MSITPRNRRFRHRTRIAYSAIVCACLLLAGCTENPESAAEEQSLSLSLPSSNVVDLTHTFNAAAIYWPTAEGFSRQVTAEGTTEHGYFYAAGKFSASEHGGTHLDAPFHFAEDGRTAEEIPLHQLMGPGVVIDVSERVTSNPEYRITSEDVRNWETDHGPIADGAILLFHTGFGQLWPDPERYLGTSLTGPEAVSALRFPGLHPEAATWLIENRNVAAVGLDTPSIDYGQSQSFETHQILSKGDVPVFENVANLDQLPSEGSVVIALPMKIERGSGAPLRIIAFTP